MEATFGWLRCFRPIRETPAVTGVCPYAVRYLGYSFCAMLPGALF